MNRCHWVNINSAEYIKYHDTEWGIPKYNDRDLFELLILESFQAGLSWLTVLNKRRAFEKAFDNFDVEKVADYTDKKVKKLLSDADIIRSKSKIEAAVNNAKIFIEIKKEWGSFSKYIWHWTDGKVIKNALPVSPTRSELSDKISVDLKKRGMKYTGTTIIYAYLQAIGVLNGHDKRCFKYKK